MTCNVHICEDLWLKSSNHWKVTLAGWGQTSSHTLADPFQMIDETELKWYVEKFAIQNPFDIERVGKVDSQLREYAIGFVAGIESAIVELSGGSCAVPGTISALCLQIVSANAESKFQKIPWEILEDMPLWAVFKVPVLICRQIKTEQNSLHEAKKGHLNVLFVSARPSYEEDEPYRIISKPVFEMTEGLETVQIHFLRPATWMGFKQLLAEREGYFDVVHFDVHGGIASGVPYLKFSPGGGSTPQRSPIRTSLVAGIIAKAKVRTVVLNACESARTEDSEVTNMAIQFVRAGAQNAVGMSFLATVELASIFMVTFYEAYLVNCLEIENAVLLARAKLHMFKKRKARFAMKVEVNDACVPILVQRYSDSSNLSVPSLLVSLDRAQQSEHSTTNLPILGRDTELLQLEEAFSVTKIVLLTGMRGAGKTAFGKYIAEWWEKSHLVDRSIFCNFLNYQTDWGKFYEDFSLSDNPTTTTSTIKQRQDAFHACRNLVVLDNCSPEITPTNQSTSWALVDSKFRDFLDAFNKKDSKCLLLMISDVSRANRWAKRAPFRQQAMSELTQADASDIARQFLNQSNFNPSWGPKDLEALEDLIHYHRKNPLFLAIFFPLLGTADHTPTRFLKRLYLTLPAGGYEAIHAELQKTYTDPVESIILFEFEQYFDAVLQEMPNGVKIRCTMILGLSPFQGQLPLGYLHWMLRQGLHQQQNSVTKSEIDSIKEFLSWLFGVGLIFNDDDLDKEARHMDEHFLKMHPLLPYLLRYVLEALSPDRPSVPSRYKPFQKLFWKFYDTRLSRLTRDRAYQNVRCLAYARDIENIMNAMVIGMELEVFGKRVENSIEAILFHPEIEALLSQRQIRRLYRVLEDCSIRYDVVPMATMSKGVLEQAFRIIDFLATHPSEERLPGHLHPNVERGKRLLQVVQRYFPEEDFAVACEMWCAVHELLARGPLTAGHHGEIQALMLKSAPRDDQFWKDVFTSSQMQMFTFVTRELSSAAFPVEPFEALIVQFTARIEVTFLNSFGDPQLCNAAVTLYSALITLGEGSQAMAKALNDLAGSKIMDMFPEARQYLAVNWALGMEPRQEIAVLESALEISMEHHDRVTEFFVRDTLFRKRVELEEMEAAVQHNERLQVLEYEIQATSFEPSSRGRIGERHLLAGKFYKHLINVSTSCQPDFESKAKNFLTKSLEYLESLPGLGEAKYYANYYLFELYRQTGMHKESLQHAVAVVRLERGPERDDLPQPRHSFEKGGFLWEYGKISISAASAGEGPGLTAIQLSIEAAVANKIGWYPIYLRKLMVLCFTAIQHYRWYEDDRFEGSWYFGNWIACPDPFKRFLWGAQELLFASNTHLAQQMIWPVTSERGPSPGEMRAWLDVVVDGPAEDVLNKLAKLTSQWPRMTPQENEGGS